jgi:diguanylate cyclase (GGDEF)-like protein
VGLGTQGSGKRLLLLPGVVLLIIGFLVLDTGFPRTHDSLIDFCYYAALAAGLCLAWRFHSSRIFSALVLLLLADRAVVFFSHLPGEIVGPGLTALEAISFLLPLNFALLALAPERGFIFPAVVLRLVVLFCQSVFVAVICRPLPAVGSRLFRGSWLNPAWFSGTRIPQVSWLAFALTLSLLLVQFLRSQKPVESCSAWALLSAFLALDTGAGGPVSRAFMATAALILAVSIVETSYLMAYHDDLTKLPSRRAFNAAIAQLEAPYAIAAVDIDHFKKFNDTYGHEAGDQVLRMVAGRLAQVTGSGRAYRVGGEEFTILFPGGNAEQAWEHLELLRALIEHSTFRIRVADRRKAKRGPDRRRSTPRSGARFRWWRRLPESEAAKELSVTVSIGIAASADKTSPVAEIIQQADKALYRAKASGRNRVELAAGVRAPRQKRAAPNRA